jgi:hypothetical protein
MNDDRPAPLSAVTAVAILSRRWFRMSRFSRRSRGAGRPAARLRSLLQGTPFRAIGFRA